MSIPELLSTKEAAKSLKLSEQRVRSLLREGKIQGQQFGGSWVIPVEAVAKKIAEECLNDRYAERTGYSQGRPRALSFFSGAMGLDLGLERAGIEVILACEVDKHCRQTITMNRPNLPLLGDIWKYTAQEIRTAAGLTGDEEIDLIAGGPPCQSFSTAGARRGLNDSRGNALLRYVELILELRPRYAVLENVRGLLSAPLLHRPHIERQAGEKNNSEEELPGGVLKLVLEQLRNGGYEASFNLYNAANFGVPQIRERVVIICHRNGEKLPHLTPTHSQDSRFMGLAPWNTVRTAIGDLTTDQHEFIDFPESRLRYYRLLSEGQYWKHLPPELQQEALGKSYFSGGGKTGFLRRLAWDKPSCTLVTHPAMPATDICHPELDRPLSIAEYKRIQQFPDDWKLAGSIIEQYRQIGNAVPVGLGAAIGRLICAHIYGHTQQIINDFPYSRYRNTDEVNWERTLAKTPIKPQGTGQTQFSDF